MADLRWPQMSKVWSLMNGEDFYLAFKEALNFFGLNWGEKDKMTVSVKGGEIAFSFENKTISIQV